MIYNQQKYSALLMSALPSVIDSLNEYNRIEEVFNKLIDKEIRSPEEDKLFNLLANLLKDYEKRMLPTLEKSSPVETLKFLMKENSLRQSNLANIFGTQSVVSEVLNKKREITKNQAKALAKKYRVSVVFIIISYFLYHLTSCKHVALMFKFDLRDLWCVLLPKPFVCSKTEKLRASKFAAFLFCSLFAKYTFIVFGIKRAVRQKLKLKLS